MTYLLSFCLVLMVFGVGVVVSNLSPYFSALGLVIVTGTSCVALGCLGKAFYSMILFLIYLGGMMVVFGFSAALAAEPFPVSLGSVYVLGSLAFFICLVLIIIFVVWNLCDGPISLLTGGFSMSPLKNETGGVSYLYLCGGVLLVFAALVLLLTLLVVVGLTWGLSIGVLRLV